jgi:hypothetical protein
VARGPLRLADRPAAAVFAVTFAMARSAVPK